MFSQGYSTEHRFSLHRRYSLFLTRNIRSNFVIIRRTSEFDLTVAIMAAASASNQLFSCPHVDVSVDPLKLRLTFGPVLSIIKPLWKLECLQYDESTRAMDKGMLNAMIKCCNAENPKDAIMVRVLNTKMSDLVSERANEIHGIKHLYLKGCAPKILATFQNGLCYEFIHGEVLKPSRLQEEAIWKQIAEKFAVYHTGSYEDRTLNRKTLIMDDINRKNLENFPTHLNIPEQNVRFQKEFPSADWVRQEYKTICAHADSVGSPIVLCHDTRPENMVWNSETGTVHFVDFEVISYNYQALELAQHFLRYTGYQPPDFSLYPDKDLQQKWLRVYLRKSFEVNGQNPDDVTDLHVERLRVQVEKYLLVALLSMVIMISIANLIEDITPGQVDFLVISTGCLQEYKRRKEEILAMVVPEL